MEPTTGQRAIAALVDCFFFLVIGALGWKGILQEGLLAAVFLMYAQGRFNIAQQKQHTAQVLSASGSGGPSNRPPPGSSTGSGISGQMQAVGPTSDRGYTTTPVEVPRPGPRKDPRRDDRATIVPFGLLDMIRHYHFKPPAIAMVAVLAVVGIGHGCASRPASHIVQAH